MRNKINKLNKQNKKLASNTIGDRCTTIGPPKIDGIPIEIIQWMNKRICPVCKRNIARDFYDVYVLQHLGYYIGHIWCNCELYSLDLYCAQPSNLIIKEENIRIKNRVGDIIRFERSLDTNNNIISINAIWLEDSGDLLYNTYKYKLDVGTLDPNNYNEEEWAKTIEMIRLYR